MLARMRSGIGGVTAIMIVVAAMWIWERSADLSPLLATQPRHPQFELWGVRCFALAAAAGAQWLLLDRVVGAIYDRRPADEMIQALMGLVGSVAVVAALGLVLAGR